MRHKHTMKPPLPFIPVPCVEDDEDIAHNMCVAEANRMYTLEFIDFDLNTDWVQCVSYVEKSPHDHFFKIHVTPCTYNGYSIDTFVVNIPPDVYLEQMHGPDHNCPPKQAEVFFMLDERFVNFDGEKIDITQDYNDVLQFITTVLEAQESISSS